jgi:signal transduction histidine kinase
VPSADQRRCRSQAVVAYSLELRRGSTPAPVARQEVDLSGPLPPLTAAVEVAAYRVTQEALTNAVRHAPGAPCRVAIRGEPQGLCIEVVDAGEGRVAAQPQGAGLATMRERAEEIGGELTIVGDPGRGTTVRLRLPLRADVAAPIEQGAAP